MTLNTVEIKSNFWSFDHPITYLTLSLGILVVSIAMVSLNNEYLSIEIIDTIFSSLIFISGLILIFSFFILKFSKENIKIINTGFLKITEDEFIINNSKNIHFNSVTYLNLSITEYRGELKHHNEFGSGLKSGTDNFITIKTDTEKIKKRILINSEREITTLNYFLASQIIKNKFTKINIKKLISIFSDDFKKTIESRNFMASKIKEGEINSTEGLLMMNYSSDKEAKELRKKYNL
ncbi:hypothetical protein KO506_02335 [Polaribacter vadi]|uniref:hypothetical protein n=1 Tax=Polaribacter TaxID=52959 RepID=UPI001C081577|nr:MULTISPECIES: hypothetical protein [Polaribacter]MBU3010230.1 hypothetical protein [Polaribacter vadi]MDO6740036.1 hypothetical protein [Polaribacter sp. 1_MG-2023]